MPLYEYLCERCGKLSTRERKPEERKKRVHCDHCPGRKLKLIISSTSFALSGGGWGTTSYEKSSPPSPKKKEK